MASDVKSGAFFMYFSALHRFYTGLLFDFTNRCYPFLVNKKALRHKKEKRNYIMKKKTVVSLAVATILALTSLTGCGNSRLSGTVATDGSTSMEKVIGALGESFMSENDGIQFTYNPTGSGSGITAVSEGRCDIGLSSRSLKDEEKAQGLTETVLALDGIAVVVNPENQVNDLSIEQIASIYTGEITNWSEVGGADAEIVVIGREAGSGTRDGFESITKTSEKCQYRQELTSTGDVITTVSQNPDAIGYTSLSAVRDNVKALSVGGVAPSEETVKDGSYTIQRPFVLVTKDGVKLSDAAQAFFDYVTSDKVADIITGAGVVPAK